MGPAYATALAEVASCRGRRARSSSETGPAPKYAISSAPLLETSHAGVAKIAKRIGYDAEAAFSKAFKRWIGVAPGAYRRNSNRRVGADRAPADLR